MHSNNKEYNNNHDVILKKYHRNWEKLFSIKMFLQINIF